MSAAKGPIGAFVERFGSELRFPQLFWLTAILFLVDLFVPDLIPFADEILLGLGTLLLGNWRRRREQPADPPPKNAPGGPVVDVTPED